MIRLKAWIRSFFAFSRSETNAFLILLPLMIVIIFSEPAYRYWFINQPDKSSIDSVRLDSLIATWKWEEKNMVASTSTITLFSFDPNNATKEDLIALGFSTPMASRIINYRSKGGRFKLKSDLLKIYGIDTAFYSKLYTFIDLQTKKETKRDNQNVDRTEKRKFEVVEKLDLNLADTAQLDKVYGIGKKLSERIVKYRNRLGGFISMDQLKEVYGLDSSVINNLQKKFSIEPNFEPKRISINAASEKELGSHPYLSVKLAKAITAYRFQHGNFTSVDEIVAIQLIKENDFKRIKPYLTINH